MSAKGNTQEDGDLWNMLGDTLDPVQVPMLEALQRIDASLSAIEMVNVLDGYLTMWEAKYHFDVLQKAGIVEPVPSDESSEAVSDFDLSFRLSIAVGRR